MSDNQVETGNLFADVPAEFSKEIFNTIFDDSNLKIERIVSSNHCTDKGQWLKQSRDEWVLVVQGAAELSFQESEKVFKLNVGDYILIPADCKHRVDWTDTRQSTVWLAVHGKPKKKDIPGESA